jgi:hypothetical protein
MPHSPLPGLVPGIHVLLDQLVLLPESLERQQQELEFNSALSAALIAVKGSRLRKRAMRMAMREGCGSG